MPDVPAEAIDALAQELCDYEGSDDPETVWEGYRGDAEDMLQRVAPLIAAQVRRETAAEVDRLRKQVAELDEDSAFLNALQTAGVDNWDGYSYACEIARGDADEG